MRLLMVTHYFASHGGGIEIVAERLAAELAGAGHSVTWLASNASPTPGNSPIVAKSIRSGHWAERALGIPFPIPAAGELATIHQAVANADAVMIHDCLYLSNIAAFVGAKRANKPVLIVQHIGDVPYRNPVLRLVMQLANRLITSTLLARADQAVFISELTARRFSHVRFRRPPVLAFNGVDSSIFRLSTTVSRQQLRARFEVGESDKLIVFAGRFVEKKGLGTVRALAEQRPKIRFVLAGHGPIDPASWGLPNVRVVGQLPAHDLANLYRAGDVLLLPSTGEGFPLVIQEALACGLRVLCGADTAQADSVAQAFLTGVAVDPTDPTVTASEFLSALDQEIAREQSDEERKQRSEFAIGRYSWARLGQLYSKLLCAITEAPDNNASDARQKFEARSLS